MMEIKKHKISTSTNCLASILIILIAFNSFNQTNAVIDDVLDVLHVVKIVASGILKTWDVIEQTNLGDQIELPITREKSKKVLKRLSELSRKIDQNHERFASFADYTIETLHNHIKANTRLELELHEIKDIMNRIRSRLDEMELYEKHQDTLESDTLIKFSEWNVSPNTYSVNHLLERLHLLFVGPKRESRTNTRSILTMLSDNLVDARDQLCATNQSAQQFLYSLYSDVAYTELKGYAMMQFSWMMLRIYEKGNFTQESNLMREEFIKRVDRTQNVLREVMKRADRTVWECDPTNHIKGKTYEEITRLLQGYIENEVDMNEDNTCRENCAYYQIGKSHGCFQDLYCAKQQRCTGKLINCQYVDSDMWICPSAFNSTRRYDYIEYENGRVLGDKNKCVRGSSKVDSWWRWLFWHCSYCFCLCDEQGLKSDRYFNLRPSESDIHKNMVITGLRFVKAKRIFHLQIQQGELLPRGNINPETLEWKPIDDYQIFDRNVKSKIDYHTLAWDNRAIDLDDIKGIDPTHIITGVRFRVVGAHLNFEAKLSEYDFENGKLIDPEINSFWQSNDNTDVTGDNRRTPITLRSPDVPTKSIAKSLPRSKHNQYVEFVNSDMDKDAAQTTVPFIDIQAVTSNPPVPLSGVGIYYKGREQYGGFIAPKLITYDFTPHVQSPFKSEEKVRTI